MKYFTKSEMKSFNSFVAEDIGIEVNEDSVWLTRNNKGLDGLVIVRSTHRGYTVSNGVNSTVLCFPSISGAMVNAISQVGGV